MWRYQRWWRSVAAALISEQGQEINWPNLAELSIARAGRRVKPNERPAKVPSMVPGGSYPPSAQIYIRVAHHPHRGLWHPRRASPRAAARRCVGRSRDNGAAPGRRRSSAGRRPWCSRYTAVIALRWKAICSALPRQLAGSSRSNGRHGLLRYAAQSLAPGPRRQSLDYAMVRRDTWAKTSAEDLRARYQRHYQPHGSAADLLRAAIEYQLFCISHIHSGHIPAVTTAP